MSICDRPQMIRWDRIEQRCYVTSDLLASDGTRARAGGGLRLDLPPATMHIGTMS